MDEVERIPTKGDQRRRFKLQAYGRYGCFCFRRMFKLKLAEPPQEIEDLFRQYSDNDVMTVEKLYKFLTEIQEENHTLETAENIFDSLKHLHVFHRRGLHRRAFFDYLFGDKNPPLAPLGVHHDMNKPLSHYFLYTGHNSYLTGNQLSSMSGVEPIVKALKSGVKGIELDLWPCKKNPDEVEVRHGGTMTSSVKLIGCLEAIKDNAFNVSDYPVIITLEDHLNSSLQAKVAEMVKKTFGEMLYPGKENLDEFPSPEELKRKILLSTKPPKEYRDSFNEQEHHEQVNNDFNVGSGPILKSESGFRNNNDELDIPIKDNEEADTEEVAVPDEYKDLIAIHTMKWTNSLLKDTFKKVFRLSLSENKLNKVVNSHATDLVRFTQRNLLRIYPKGTRVFSSNYNPLIGWTHGAQMVAFNMQGYEKNLWIMHGMFRANGGCGYLKKPEFLLSDEAFDPKIERPVKKTLKVKLYMGDGWHLDFHQTHFDPCSPPDFFTKVEILGVPTDKRKEMTSYIEDQWSPIWDKEFVFPLRVPELALLRVEVREFDPDRRHNFGGQTCLPVSELRSGIRAVPLYSKKGVKYDHVKLLMRFQFTYES